MNVFTQAIKNTGTVFKYSIQPTIFLFAIIGIFYLVVAALLGIGIGITHIFGWSVPVCISAYHPNEWCNRLDLLDYVVKGSIAVFVLVVAVFHLCLGWVVVQHFLIKTKGGGDVAPENKQSHMLQNIAILSQVVASNKYKNHAETVPDITVQEAISLLEIGIPIRSDWVWMRRPNFTGFSYEMLKDAPPKIPAEWMLLKRDNSDDTANVKRYRSVSDSLWCSCEAFDKLPATSPYYPIPAPNKFAVVVQWMLMRFEYDRLDQSTIENMLDNNYQCLITSVLVDSIVQLAKVSTNKEQSSEK